MGASLERAYANFQVKLLLLLTVIALNVSEVHAQSYTGDALANDLRRNVVRIVSRWTNGTQNKAGFGFVVGEREGLLYIITADHVVRDGFFAGSPGITFYFDQGKEYPGDLLDTHLVESQGDVAVIRIPAPPGGLSWRRDALASTVAARGHDVWFVGLQGNWYVPVRPGAINNIDPGRELRFEGLDVRSGTSGGPLISKSGILGMIVTDNDVFGKATSIDAISRAVRDWAYPWDLTLTSSSLTPAPVPVSPVPTPTSVPTTPTVSKPTPAISSTSLWTSEYSTRDNRDIWQQDILLPNGSIGIHGVDLDECAKRCSGNANCTAFAYDRWNRSCYPKRASPASILDPHSMIAVKKPGEVPKVSQKDAQIALLRNKRMHGAPYKNSSAFDHDSCRSTCNEDILCVAYNFLKQTNAGINCEMYKVSDGYDTDTSVDAGYKYQAP
jgi:hypothetical protein